MKIKENLNNKIFTIKPLFILKRFVKVFLVSFLWVTIPIVFIFIPKLDSEISYNESFLTPSSVSVNGYTRDDGTYVDSYSRRPPGSVSHDKPFEKEIEKLNLTKRIIYILLFISILIVIIYGYQKLHVITKDYEDYILNKILSELDFDFTELFLKPNNLVNKRTSRNNYVRTYYCLYCKTNVEKYNFHYSNFSKRHPVNVCLKCISNQELRFSDELFYINKYEKNLELFTQKFINVSETEFKIYNFNKRVVENYFHDEIRQNRVRKTNKSSEYYREKGKKLLDELREMGPDHSMVGKTTVSLNSSNIEYDEPLSKSRRLRSTRVQILKEFGIETEKGINLQNNPDVNDQNNS